MGLASKTKASQAEKNKGTKISKPDLKILSNPSFGCHDAQTRDVCEYIASLAGELRRTAANANQDVLAYFLSMAAQEALAQASRAAIAK